MDDFITYLRADWLELVAACVGCFLLSFACGWGLHLLFPEDAHHNPLQEGRRDVHETPLVVGRSYDRAREKARRSHLRAVASRDSHAEGVGHGEGVA
jgi:hypothetical protein